MKTTKLLGVRGYNKTESKADFEAVQLGFRVYGIHARMVQQAAAKEAEKRGIANLTVAAYVRSIILPWVAAELGVPCPEYDSLEGASDVVAQAAARMGITVREYERRVAREHAARELGSLPPQRDPRRESVAPPSQSGMRAATRR